MPTLRSDRTTRRTAAYRYVADGDGMIPFTRVPVPTQAVLGGAGAVAAFYDRLAPQSARTLAEPFRVDLPAALDKTLRVRQRRAVDAVPAVRRGGAT